MNLRHLEIFKAVAEAGSLRAAARQAALTQPALTYAIRELERSVRAPLLVRSSAGVVPTPIGEVLLRRAQGLLAEVRRTEEELAWLRDGVAGSLRVALSSFAMASLLPAALQDFRRQQPGVSLDLQEFSGEASQLWAHREFDLAVLSEMQAPPGAAADDTQRELLLEFPLRVVARTGHPLGRARSFGRLGAAMWVVPGYAVQALHRLLPADAQPAAAPDIIRCHSIHLGLTLVRKADALSLVAQSLFDNQRLSRGLVALRLKEPLPTVQLSLLTPAQRRPGSAGQVFMACIRRAAAALHHRPGEGARRAAQP
ncbi:LysR family transcriptional regulator [Xenophilus sp. Marseille-Q4582]|uniref:LysR family transcriptional regulator n=1 Tax=Xenophilus sp. Marseille-Q4582 TaxID=2866600 RepID=UPI001CE40626|nr:LysR family transcriptional regulator [Xenophilus sp. Marseille-Q4582]